MAKKRSRRASQLWDVLGPLALIALLWRRRRQPPDQPPDQPPGPPIGPGKDGERPGAHLIPGQVSLVVRHQGPLSEARLDELIKSLPALERLRPLNPRILFDQVATFGQASTFSLVPIAVDRQPNDRRLFDLIRAVDEQLKQGSATIPPTSKQRPADDAATASGAADSGELVVVRATPNWTAGAAIERNGSGSPGAKPIPYRGAVDPATRLLEWRTRLVELMRKRDIRFREEALGEGVHVYILDTAPDAKDLERARQRWGNTQLIDTLLAEGRLIPEYAGGTHLLQYVDLYHDNANYVMSDHGLFVASIIHALAPRATLHLVEVLNPYGVGSLLSIAHGFAVAADATATYPKVVVNASLGFEVAPPDGEWLAELQKTDPFWAGLSPDDITELMQPLEDICELFADVQPEGKAQRSLRVVAAAGNDKQRGQQRPPARYPAAFDKVLGVGALDHTGGFTDYSNLDDRPAGSGIRIFGGERVDKPGSPAHGKTDPDHGMPGVYSGAFPDGEANTTGWALWAGTSFATPIITGAVAALISATDMDFGEAVDFVRDL